MYRYLFVAILLCATLRSSAQDVPLPAQGKVDSLPVFLRKVIIDSVNKRAQFVRPSAAAGSAALQQLASAGDLRELSDSARREFLQYLHASDADAQLKLLRRSVGSLGDSAAIARFADNKLRGFYALIPPDASRLRIPGGLKNSLRGASVQTSYSDSSGATSGLWNNVVLQDQVSLGSIPFDINYSNLAQQRLPGAGLLQNNFGKIAFNKEAYLRQLNKHLQSNYDFKKYFVQDVDYRAFVKTHGAAQMDALRQRAGSRVEDLKHKVSVEQLLGMDSLQLKQLLFDGMPVGEIASARQVLSGLSPSAQHADSAAKALYNRVSRYDEIQEYYNQLVALLHELGGGADVLKALASQRMMERGMDAYVNDAGTTSRMAKQMLPMSFLQKLMLGMKQLNFGNFATSASKGTVSDLFMTGAAGSFFSKNNFVMIGAGKRNDLGMQYGGLDQSINTHAYATQFIRLGKGDMDKAHTHVSALNANAKSSERSRVVSNALARNTFAGAVSKQLNLGEWGRLNVELSKSNNRFSNVITGRQELAAVPKAALAGFFDDFWTTFSTRLNYTGNVKQYRLHHSAYINYSGLGYTNPGNPYAGRGSIQYGLDVKRSWLKNKASLRFKTDVRNMAQSPVTDNKWKNLQFALDGHYRLNRRLSLDLRLNQASMNEKRDGHSVPVFLSRKAAAMMQSNGKLGAIPYSGNVMLGVQQMDYQLSNGSTKSTFINANVMKTLFLGSNSLSWALMYNKDVKGTAIYGNLLSSDLTYGYVLLKKLSASSGITFLNSEQMVRQAGIRQSVGAQVLKRLSLNLFIDARKDFYRGREYYYYDNFRTELSIHYQMN